MDKSATCPARTKPLERPTKPILWASQVALNIQKTKIMASGPITSWQIDGETMETVTDFILGGSKITADCDCSYEIKWHLLLGRKVMTNLDSILKSRDITLQTKVCLVKAMISPVVMYGCESWTLRKLSARELMLLNCGVGEDSWESLGQQGDPTSPSWFPFRKSVLNIHWKDWCWSWNSNTLATSCEELTHWKRPWCWERLRAGREGDNRGWDGWMASPAQWTWVWVSSGSWGWTGKPGVLQALGSQRVGHSWVAELNWTCGTSGKEPTCQCRRHKRHRFDPWVGKIPWRGAWQPTPVFLPGESHEQRSRLGYSPKGRKESDTTEWLSTGEMHRGLWAWPELPPL